MLDALLPGVRGFRGTDVEWKVPNQGQSQCPGFGGDPEVSAERKQVINLHTIVALPLDGLHGEVPLGTIRSADRVRPNRLGPVNNGSRQDHARPEERSLADLLSPAQVQGETA